MFVVKSLSLYEHHPALLYVSQRENVTGNVRRVQKTKGIVHFGTKFARVPGAKDTGLKGQSPDGLKLSPEGALPFQTGVFSAGKVAVEANSLALTSSPQD